MHIVYVTGRFVENEKEPLGGMDNYIYKIGMYMLTRGYNVTILTVGKSERIWNYKGIKVYSIGTQKANPEILGYRNKWVNIMIRDICFNRALSKIDTELPISIVQYAGWYGVGALYNRKYPSVMRISSYTKIQLATLHTPKEIKLYTFFEVLASKNFDSIIAPSNALGKPFSKDIKRKVTIFKTPYTHNPCLKENWGRYNTMLKGKKYFLFFGRLSTDKGIGTISRCIERILSIYKDFYFVFAGLILAENGSNCMAVLKKSAKEHGSRVIYLGNLRQEELIPIERMAECVILPSLMDNLPNACLEAMDYNGIVIGTKGASFDEIIEDGKSGYLIEIDNSDQLVEKIGIAVNMSEEERDKMKSEAIIKLKEYDPQVVGMELEQFYKSIMKRRKKR